MKKYIHSKDQLLIKMEQLDDIPKQGNNKRKLEEPIDQEGQNEENRPTTPIPEEPVKEEKEPSDESEVAEASGGSDDPEEKSADPAVPTEDSKDSVVTSLEQMSINSPEVSEPSEDES